MSDNMVIKTTKTNYPLEHQVYDFVASEIVDSIEHNFIFGFNKKAKNINDAYIILLDTMPLDFDEVDFEVKSAEIFGETL